MTHNIYDKNNILYPYDDPKDLKKQILEIIDNEDISGFIYVLNIKPSLLQKAYEMTFTDNDKEVDIIGNIVHCVCAKGFTKGIDHIIKHYPKIDLKAKASNGFTPLIFASYSGNIEFIRLLIKAKADLNQGDLNGYTPLHIAVGKGYRTIIDELINSGADINKATIDTQVTPLHLAVENGHAEIVAKLINAGANLALKNNMGCTALHIAAYNGYEEKVMQLINAKADINDRDFFGVTALHFAASGAHKGTVELLIKHGAYNLPNHKGYTPLHMAVGIGKLEIIDVNKEIEDPQNHEEIPQEEDYLECVKTILLSEIVDLYTTDQDGRNYFFFAHAAGFERIKEILTIYDLFYVIMVGNIDQEAFVYNIQIEGHQDFFKSLALSYFSAQAMEFNDVNIRNYIAKLEIGLSKYVGAAQEEKAQNFFIMLRELEREFIFIKIIVDNALAHENLGEDLMEIDTLTTSNKMSIKYICSGEVEEEMDFV